MNWNLDPPTLGLTFIALAPGFSGNGTPSSPGYGGNAGLDDLLPRKALIETLIVGLSGAYVTKSWWPIVGPALYIAVEYWWLTTRTGQSVDIVIYPEGNT